MAVLVACTAFKLATRMATVHSRVSRYWLLAGATTLGTGIWSMHFIGMLALHLPTPLTYSLPITLASLGVAILTSAFVLVIAGGRNPGMQRVTVGALVMGLGISAMHYSGMNAMQLMPMITYAPGLVVASVLVAIVSSFASLWLAFGLAEFQLAHLRSSRYAAAVFMGIAIAGMHYTAMAGVIISPHAHNTGTLQINGNWLALIIGAFALGLLAISLISDWFYVRLESGNRLHNDAIANVNARLEHLSLHDALTGLPNRTLLLDRLSQSILFATRYRGKFAVLTLDLDRFKTVNESLGFSAGDRLLNEVTTRLSAIVRKDDTLARSGGDEFVIVVNDVRDLAEIEGTARHIIADLGKPFLIHPEQVHTTPSIGISMFPADGVTADALLARSDEAVLHAKKIGRNTYQFFRQGMSTFTREDLELENDLRHALELKQFHLHYQPKVDVRSGTIIGVEALLRWRHPRRGSVSPDAFIPLAEQTGLIIPIGEWVLREACRQARHWQIIGLPFLRISVNLSATQFRQADLEAVVRSALQDAQLNPDVLELELTESSIMTDPEESAAILEKLSTAGVLVAIDDFGKGYSSMSYLQRFPIDKLKIDRSFVSDLTSNPDSAAIVTAIISLAHGLRMKVVAEGVESHGQLDYLRKSGCDQYQGYLCSRPVPPAELAELLWARGSISPALQEEMVVRTHSKLAAYMSAT